MIEKGALEPLFLWGMASYPASAGGASGRKIFAEFEGDTRATAHE